MTGHLDRAVDTLYLSYVYNILAGVILTWVMRGLRWAENCDLAIRVLAQACHTVVAHMDTSVVMFAVQIALTFF